MVRVVTSRPAVATGRDGKAVAVVYPVFVTEDRSIHAVAHVDRSGTIKTTLLTATKDEGLRVGNMSVREWMGSAYSVLTAAVSTEPVSNDQLEALVPDVNVMCKLLSGLSCSEPASVRNAEAVNAILSERRLSDQLLMLPSEMQSPIPPQVRCCHGHRLDCVASARRAAAAGGGVILDLRCTGTDCDQVFPVGILRHAGLMPAEADAVIAQNSLPPLPSPLLADVDLSDLFL